MRVATCRIVDARTVVRRPVLLLLFAVVLVVVALGLASPAAAAEYLHYPDQYYSPFTSSSWPSDSAWQPISTETEGLDGIAAQLDFVGNPTYPGIYMYSNASYVFFRVRVAFDGTVISSTFHDSVFVMLETNDDANLLPDFAFAWDSKSANISKHGLEMTVYGGTVSTTWGNITFDDYDGNGADKILTGTHPDINGSGQGYIRTVDQVSVTNPAWNTSATHCTFIDFAVEWSYLTDTGKSPRLPGPGAWRVQVGSRADATDHNALTGDIGRGASPSSTVKDVWGAPTSATVTDFRTSVVDGSLVAAWQTSGETGTAGYFLERLDAKSGRWVTVNGKIVPAAVESPAGSTYAVADKKAPVSGPTTYRLREVEMTGGGNLYGPYTVMPTTLPAKTELARQLGAGSGFARVSRPAGTAGADAATALRAPVAASPANSLCIEVTGPGLYTISAAEVASGLGMDVATARSMIAGGKLALTNKGNPVAMMTASEGSALYFYGQALDTLYTSTNVYWLKAGKATKMASAKAVAPSGSIRTTFVDKAHFERDLLALVSLFSDPESDFWLWDYVVAGDASYGSKSFTITAPGALQGVDLTVALQGMSTTGVSGEHHAVVKLNGIDLGSVSWTASVPKTATFTIPAGLLVQGTNTVQVVGLLDGGVPYSLFAVDSLDLTYQRQTRAVAGQLQLREATAGRVKVDGLSAGTIWVLDLSKPASPTMVKATSSGTAAAGQWVVFTTAATAQDYLVATSTGALHPQAITPTATGTLKSAGRGAEYVVITAPGLLASARSLAD